MPGYGQVRISVRREGMKSISRIYSATTGEFIRELVYTIPYVKPPEGTQQ